MKDAHEGTEHIVSDFLFSFDPAKSSQNVFALRETRRFFVFCCSQLFILVFSSVSFSRSNLCHRSSLAFCSSVIVWTPNKSRFKVFRFAKHLRVQSDKQSTELCWVISCSNNDVTFRANLLSGSLIVCATLWTACECLITNRNSKSVNEHFLRPSLHLSPINSARSKAGDKNRKTFPKQLETFHFRKVRLKMRFRCSYLCEWNLNFGCCLLGNPTWDWVVCIDISCIVIDCSLNGDRRVKSINQTPSRRRWSNCNEVLIELAETRP